MNDYQDEKINLVMNKMTKDQYQKAQISGLIDDKQLYFITDDHSPISGDSHYRLQKKELRPATITIEGVQTNALTCQVQDLEISTVEISSSSTPVYVYLPSKVDDNARDFCVRVEVLVSTPPTFGFLGYNNEPCDFESEDSEWCSIQTGVNLFNFTETKQ